MLRTATILTLLLGLAACGGGNNNDPVQEPAPNAAPTIDMLGDRSIEANSSTDTIGFSVDDDATAADALVVTASSDNPALVDDSGITLGGSGADRTLVVTPRENQTGSVVITLTVADEEDLSATASFTLTVEPQTASFSASVRAIFGSDENAQPQEINALQFNDDGGNFDDLVGP